MDFNLNYDIPNKIAWTPEFVGVVEVEELINGYSAYKSKIKDAYDDVRNKDYFDGYAEYHRNHYLRETLIGEGNIAGSTTMLELEKYVDAPDNNKISNKIINLKNCMDELFPNHFVFVDSRSKLVVERFTPEFIQQLHEKVAANLVETPGVYRTKWAAPSQEYWLYLYPNKIAEKLNKLCRNVREKIGNEDPHLSDKDILYGRVKVVATFLTEFLQIHPFSNGNGRVGRLLTSWLLADMAVVPVPLLTNSTTSNTFFECVRDARRTTPYRPTNLARLILESVIHTMRMVCVSLDI